MLHSILALMKLNFNLANESDNPDDHKKIVRERIKTANPEEMIAWKEARKLLHFKGKS